ncbi:hypothetical protein EVAR_37835_1 [Eumeta japonica]|uniref:Uncharacterized protein n=1 Tax=Eumeta variegata TaxID=151549 RepID=A0A4C1X054_EUMVA|nr:hypothetical protein EVAR_37835_1 [Eumeta japonica]
MVTYEFYRIFKGKPCRRTIREWTVTAAHGHSQLQKHYQCVAGLLGKNGRSIEGAEGYGSPEPLFPDRNTPMKAVSSRLCSIKIWYSTSRAGPFLCWSQVSPLGTV